MTELPAMEVCEVIERQADLFPDADLVALAGTWEPAREKGGRFSGKIITKDEALCAAICEAVLLNHSVRRIARALHVSRNSVRAVMEVLEKRGKIEPLKQRLSGRLGELAELCACNLVELAQDGAIPANVASIAMGIAIDKRALLESGPSAEVDGGPLQVDLTLEAVNGLVRRLGAPKEPAPAASFDSESIGKCGNAQ